MKRLAVVSMLLLAAACQQQQSKLEQTGVAQDSAQALLSQIEARLKTLEESHAAGAHGKDDGAPDPLLVQRVQQLEAQLVKREEALAFLEMAYAQQKQQQDQKEAGEPDPNAVFAVDISGALRAGQVEGPSSAMITIVEAWDFA